MSHDPSPPSLRPDAVNDAPRNYPIPPPLREKFTPRKPLPLPPSPRKPSRPWLPWQFGLRTLLILFLLIAALLGLVGRDVASTWQQRRIANAWLNAGGDRVGWKEHAWRGWRRDVVSLSAHSLVQSSVVVPVSELPLLNNVSLDRGASPEQLQEIMRVKSLRTFSMPVPCREEDLAGIENLRQLQSLTLRGGDAHKVLRRLRGHPRLSEATIDDRYDEQLLILNDLLTMPKMAKQLGIRFAYNNEPRFFECVDRAEATAAILGARSSSARVPNFYNLALLGAEIRHDVFLDLELGDKSHRSSDTRSCVMQRGDDICFVADPVVDNLTVLSRVAWMADRVLIVVNADDGVTERIRALCMLARAMQAPSVMLVVVPGANTSEMLKAQRVAECQTLAEALLPSSISSSVIVLPGRADMAWQKLLADMTLRPPFPPNRKPQTIHGARIKLHQPLTIRPRLDGQVFLDVYAHGRHSLGDWFDVTGDEFTHRAYDLTDGEEVIIADGDRVLGLGTHGVAESPSIDN